MKYHILLGLVNLCLGVLGFVFLMHGIFKRVVGTYRMGTAFWILELLAIVIEIVIYILITFGQIFAGETNFFLGLLKFIGVKKAEKKEVKDSNDNDKGDKEKKFKIYQVENRCGR